MDGDGDEPYCSDDGNDSDGDDDGVSDSDDDGDSESNVGDDDCSLRNTPKRGLKSKMVTNLFY